jgi:hypothetical protein
MYRTVGARAAGHQEGIMRFLRRTTLLALAAALAVVVPLSLASPASASDHGPPATPTHRVDGMTGGELQGQFWAYVYSTASPSTTCFHLGQTGQVYFLPYEPPTCDITEGTPIFVLGWSTTCSDVEPPPYFAVGEAAQQACARTAIDLDMVQAITVKVDDGPIVDIHADRFGEYAPQQDVLLPPDNFLGLPPGTHATLSAYGWVALVGHLRPGHHTIHTEVVFPTDANVRTIVVNVVPVPSS